MSSFDASDELTSLYASSYPRLVRLAIGLVDSEPEAEEVVQDAFAACLELWSRKGVPGNPELYLRQAVVNLGRKRIRRRMLARRLIRHPERSVPSAEQSAVESDGSRAVLNGLRRLPRRQRECVVLRHLYGGSVAECAEILGISQGAVKTHTHRGLRALETILEPTDES